MMQKFKRVPEPLQKQIMLRSGLCAVFLVLAITLLFATGDLFLWLPCGGSSLIFMGSAVLLLRQAVSEDYVVIDGICIEAGLTAVRRRVKYIIIKNDIYKIKVTLRNRTVNIQNGMGIRLFVANSAPVYEQDGLQVLSSYLALERIEIVVDGQGPM